MIALAIILAILGAIFGVLYICIPTMSPEGDGMNQAKPIVGILTLGLLLTSGAFFYCR